MQKNKHFFILIFLFIGANISAQNQLNSPYSRFGIGDLQSNVLSEYAAMGGTSIASNNAKIVNPYNPASYTSFKPNSFIFSTGGMHQTTNMLTTDLEQTTNYTSFSHLILGFPITKKIGASIGMLPYSRVGYVLENSEFINNIGKVDYTYNGDGGLNMLYFGGAYQVMDNLSVGANANYLFGGLNQKKK